MYAAQYMRSRKGRSIAWRQARLQRCRPQPNWIWETARARDAFAARARVSMVQTDRKVSALRAGQQISERIQRRTGRSLNELAAEHQEVASVGTPTAIVVRNARGASYKTTAEVQEVASCDGTVIIEVSVAGVPAAVAVDVELRGV